MSSEFSTTITECPGCRAPLALPGDATDGALLQCPSCDAQFTHAQASLREMRLARIVLPPTIALEPSPPLVTEVDFELSPPEQLAAIVGPALASTVAEITPATAAPLPSPLEQFESLKLEPVAELPVETTPIPHSDFNGGSATIAMSPEATVRIDDNLPDEFSLPGELNDAEEIATGDYDFDSELDDDEPPADHESEPHDEFARNDSYAHDDQYDLSPTRRPRRRRSSPVRTLVGIVGGGIAGLFLAAYALLWLKGQPADFFKLADVLPEGMLPPSMRSSDGAVLAHDHSRPVTQPDNATLAGRSGDSSATESPTASEPVAPTNDSETGAQPPTGQVAGSEPVQIDSQVTPASSLTDSSPAELGPQEPPTPPAAPKVKWPSTPIVGDLVNPHLYSLDELADAVAGAESAGRRFIAGDLAQPASVRDMGQAYIQLCAVAERLTLTDPAAFTSSLFAKQALAKEPINLAAGNVDRRNDLAVIAARWLQHDKRQNSGTLFVARVVRQRPQGDWTECDMELTYGEKKLPVTVLMDKIRFPTGADAAVAGVIVADPQTNIKGYKGNASQVVVAGYAFDPLRHTNKGPAEAAPSFDLPTN